MVALLIVGNQHEGSALILAVAEAVVVHSLVATAVAKREYRHLAYFLCNLQYLVGLQILDNQFVRTYQIVFFSHGEVHTRGVSLLG